MKEYDIRLCVLLPIVLVVTLFLWLVPSGFFGIDNLTVVQQRVIAIFAFAALMWMFEIIPNWTTSLLVILISLLTVSDKGIGLFCDPKFGTLVDYKDLMASLFIPILIVLAKGMADPLAANHASFVAFGGTYSMISFVAMCASLAMIFPISTPPNAIAASTGLVKTREMARIGIIIGLVGAVLGFFWLTRICPFNVN